MAGPLVGPRVIDEPGLRVDYFRAAETRRNRVIAFTFSERGACDLTGYGFGG